MPFNENQLFYASLWWMQSLPGGAAHAHDVCECYGMKEAAMRATTAKGEEISREQAHDFFESIYNALQNGDVPVQRVTDGSGASFMALRGAADNALAAAGLPQAALPDNTAMFLHDDGQILTPMMVGKKQKTIPQDYPGRPETPYRMVNLSEENFYNRPAVTAVGIFGQAAGPLPCIEVHEDLQIGQGESFTVTRPGDRILWSATSPQIIHKSQIESGQVSLVPHLGRRPSFS